MSKKINPRKRPASQADLKKSSSEAISLAMALFLTVLLDKFDFDNDQIANVWDEVNSLSESVCKGYVNLHDLKQVLSDEYNIDLS